ncbi:MAG: transposase, partial [Dehalococcoidales bacterium]|nr:transposase [Dehalococcoidales bacterium]
MQMGLFIDDNGIPIAYRLFPGNATDQTTLIPALEKSIDSMGFQKVIVVADGGLNTGTNIAHILSRGNGYILSKSTKKSDKAVKEWILDQSGYEWNDTRTFKLKSMLRSRKIKNEAGQTLEVKEKLVCYWSKKHY